MAFATRTLIDTGKTTGGAGKVVILLDLDDHNASATALDADGLNGFANGAKLNIRKIRWGLVSGADDGIGGSALIEFKGASSDTTAIRLAGSGLYDGPAIAGNATNTTATSADIECIPVNTTGFIMIEFSKDAGWTG